MIRQAYLNYNSGSEAARDPIWMAPAPVFYPLHAAPEALRQSCSGQVPDGSLKKAMCDVLRAREYKNLPIGPETIAAHQWSHIWLGGEVQNYRERTPISHIIPKDMLL